MLPYHYELCLLEINFKFTGDKKRTLFITDGKKFRQIENYSCKVKDIDFIHEQVFNITTELVYIYEYDHHTPVLEKVCCT